MPYSPEARAQVEAYEAGKRDLARRGGYVPPAVEYALEGVGAGWPVYSTTRRYVDDYPVGGVVVEVDRYRWVDPDTGEVSEPRTRYRCLDTHHVPNDNPRRPWQYVDADEVALPLKGLARVEATACGYWLLRHIPPNRKVFAPDDVERIHDAWILAKAAALL